MVHCIAGFTAGCVVSRSFNRNRKSLVVFCQRLAGLLLLPKPIFSQYVISTDISRKHHTPAQLPSISVLECSFELIFCAGLFQDIVRCLGLEHIVYVFSRFLLAIQSFRLSVRYCLDTVNPLITLVLVSSNF